MWLVGPDATVDERDRAVVHMVAGVRDGDLYGDRLAGVTGTEQVSGTVRPSMLVE
ncbi:hypothetical protein Prum_101230 [Phytohabitans rumicis]|uniref:Uncharacterized protein n=1 Tax=Phytohabitans rumicis TaxID=1076125 RepID=A0A6V8LN82_9ACTN|nr:hypothetical protein Prum_101230 [Phytohabitans rumicis]